MIEKKFISDDDESNYDLTIGQWALGSRQASERKRNQNKNKTDFQAIRTTQTSEFLGPAIQINNKRARGRVPDPSAT